ncbi:site-specific DNA-methyltransferase [Spiroplasma endosymbiont of Cantharis lateralis]|uniref:DNA-methyltransferase n=1 Tax=Spiroplasma endosymbiont of Cantharis lateralis TaxID=3066277 RepID=UPI00313D65A1
MNKLFNEDIELFFKKRVKSETIDLIIADPPYNVLEIEWDMFKSELEYFTFMKKWLIYAFDSLKEGGTLYLFNTAYNSGKLISIIEKIGYHFIDWITWYKKDGFTGSKKKYVNNQETILFFSKGKNWKFNYNEIRTPYVATERLKHAAEKGILKNGKRWFPNEKGKLCTNVWEFSSERHNTKVKGKVIKGFHPTPKPSKLIERIVLASSDKNDLVLDLFSGTGTTTFICKNLNRNSLGCELNKEYYEYAIKRIGVK